MWLQLHVFITAAHHMKDNFTLAACAHKIIAFTTEILCVKTKKKVHENFPKPQTYSSNFITFVREAPLNQRTAHLLEDIHADFELTPQIKCHYL
jgi:hypothetical protein